MRQVVTCLRPRLFSILALQAQASYLPRANRRLIRISGVRFVKTRATMSRPVLMKMRSRERFGAAVALVVVLLHDIHHRFELGSLGYDLVYIFSHIAI